MEVGLSTGSFNAQGLRNDANSCPIVRLGICDDDCNLHETNTLGLKYPSVRKKIGCQRLLVALKGSHKL
jgi:hypothetical protein